MTEPQPCPTFLVGDPDALDGKVRVRLHCVREGQPHPPWSSGWRSPRREHMGVVNGTAYRWPDAKVDDGPSL